MSRRGRPIKHPVTNLDPLHLKINDLTDLSGHQRSCIFFHPSPTSDEPSSTPKNVLISYKDSDSPFPPETRGLFYFHRRQHAHVAGGELRFRTFNIDAILTQSELEERFNRGIDLPDAVYPFLPWRLSLVSLASTSRPVVYNMLMKQNLVTPSMDQEIQRLLADFRSRDGSEAGAVIHRLRAPVVEKITDPFMLDFEALRHNYIFLHEGAITRWRWKYGISRPTKSLYSGKAWVRFELARDINGDPAVQVVLRVLRFAEYPDPHDTTVQVEGELVKTLIPRNHERVWTVPSPERFITPSSMKILEQTYLNT